MNPIKPKNQKFSDVTNAAKETRQAIENLSDKPEWMCECGYTYSDHANGTVVGTLGGHVVTVEQYCRMKGSP